MIYILIITLIVFIYDFSTENIRKGKINVNLKLSFENLLSLRGLLTLMIIYHHLVVCCSIDVKPVIINSLLSHMGYLCVGIFLFMSGFGLKCKFNSNGEAYLYSIVSKVIWFLLVFLLINLFYFILSPLYSSYMESLPTLFLGINSGHFLAAPSWFLINLIFLYLIFYTASKFGNTFIITLGIIILNLLYLYFDYPAIWGISNLSFIVGIYLANYLHENEFSISPLSLLGMSCCFLLVFTIISCLPFLGSGKGKYLCQLLSTPFFCFLALSVYSLFIPKRKCFSFIGKHSLEIFLIHVLIYKILRGNYIYINNDFIFIFLTIVCSIIISVPIEYINRLLAKLLR